MDISITEQEKRILAMMTHCNGQIVVLIESLNGQIKNYQNTINDLNDHITELNERIKQDVQSLENHRRLLGEANATIAKFERESKD